jgi:DNA polymerase I
VRIAVVPEPGGGGADDPRPAGRLQPLAEDGTPLGPQQRVPDLVAEMAARERTGGARWVWASAETVYPRLLAAGTRPARCYDVLLTEGLLTAAEGRFGAPRSLQSAWARLRGLPVPDDPAPEAADRQPALFGQRTAGPFDDVDPLDMLVAVHADQVRRIAATPEPARFGLLVAAESAGALIAAELAFDGLPWRTDLHDAVLTELLGPRPFGDAKPRKLAELAARIGAEFGYPRSRPFNPDSPAQVIKALRDAGFPVDSTRSSVLRRVDHPAAALLLEYKELSRLFTANGWVWQDTWVSDGRFRPEYVVGGVVSGRWATRGGGALQLPKTVRRAVVADQGWALVVADAGQLEPRVLAAVSGDAGLARAAAAGDLYAALAASAFDGNRPTAKIALLAAMYGQTTGTAAAVLPVMYRRYPAAMRYVEAAARAGEEGRVVYSRLGRVCPPPSTRWRAVVGGQEDVDQSDGPDPVGPAGPSGLSGPDGPGFSAEDAAAGDRRRSGQAARARGRFTRNFVIQASAADWAMVWLAALRRRLAELAAANPGLPAPRLVLFVHDEVAVHTPRALAAECELAVAAAAQESRRLTFGDTAVNFPLQTAIVDCYADAK